MERFELRRRQAAEALVLRSSLNQPTRAWRSLRDQVLARDAYTCQGCGAPATHVDHVAPVVARDTDHPANLQSLCAETAA